MNQLFRFVFLVGIVVVVSSCGSNNYVLNSINSPFVDSSNFANIKLISSMDAGQIQTAATVQKRFTIMGDIFTRYKWQQEVCYAYSGGIGYNFLTDKSNSKVRANVSVGFGHGETSYQNYDNWLTNNQTSCNSEYDNAFVQLGLSILIDKKNKLNLFYKGNYVHFNNYDFHRYSHYDSRLPSKETFIEDVNFNDKSALIHQFSGLLTLNAGKLIDLLIEAGFGIPIALFNTNNYKTYTSSKNGTIENSNSATLHPNFVPVYFRLGIQLKVPKKISSHKKEPYILYRP